MNFDKLIVCVQNQVLHVRMCRQLCHSFELGVTIFFGLEKRPLQKQRDGREGHPL